MVENYKVQTTMCKVRKLQRYTVQQSIYSNYKWNVTFKTVNHYVVHLKLTEILYINYTKINKYVSTWRVGVRQKQRERATVVIQAQGDRRWPAQG